MSFKGLISAIGTGISNNTSDILTIGGIVLLFAAGVKAAKDTENAIDILDEQQELIDDINEEHTEEEMQLPAVKKEVRSVKIRTAGRLAWNYKWALGMAIAGGSMVLYGHHLIKGKYVATAIAYNGLQAAYDTVIDRAREAYGENAVKYLKYGIKEEIVEKEVVDDEGNVTKVNETRDILYDEFSDPNLMIFRHDSLLYRECQGSILHMRSQAEAYQNYLNQQYNAGVVIMKNDIIRYLFGSESIYLDDAGQILGYSKWDSKNRESNVKDCIDFNLFTFVDKDPDTDEDITYLAMCPNIPGIVSIDASKRKTGKYIAMR